MEFFHVFLDRKSASMPGSFYTTGALTPVLSVANTLTTASGISVAGTSI